MSLVLAILLTHAAHERTRLTGFLQADKLNGVNLMLWAQSLLVRLVSQGHTTVFGQCAGGVGELGALSTQVGGTHSAVHGGCVALVLITSNYTLEKQADMSENEGCSSCRGDKSLVRIQAKSERHDNHQSYFTHAFQGILCHS